MAERLQNFELNPGTLRHRITIEEDVGTATNEAGEHVPLWSTKATSVPAFVEQTGGNQYFLAAQTMGQATTKVTLRWTADLSIRDRFLFGNRRLYPVHLDNVENRNRKIVAYCREEV
jgi:SPP1 family predicted phage head-tail adaptor